MKLLKLVVSFLLVDFVFSQNVNLTLNPANYPGALCNRDCNGAEKRICYFTLVLEYYHALGPACGNCGEKGSNSDCYRNQCISGDGAPRALMSINRQVPGPALHVCQNDLIVADVTNMMMGTSTTIHWHGLHQRQTPYFDGVPYVSQCPINFANTFRYSFWASEAGTQWYHSHSGLQRANGHYGSLIIRRPDALEPNRDLYDEDLPEHVIIISDIMQFTAEMYDPGLRQDPQGIAPDNLIINGRGMRRANVTRSGFATVHSPLEVFRVEKGKRYRFRMINAMSHVCPTSLEIQGHSLTILSSDSFDLHPVTVERLISNSGERYDFVVDATQCEGNFWIRVAGVGVCDVRFRMDQYAILTYDQTTPLHNIASNYQDVPQRTDLLNDLQRTLNHPNTVCGPSDQVNLCVTDLSSYDLGKGIVDVKPNVALYLGFQQNLVSSSEASYFFKGANYEHFMSLANTSPTPIQVSSINRISFQFPPISLQSQYDEISNSGIVFCKSGELPQQCNVARAGDRQYCNCIHRIQIKLGSIVELIIKDDAPNRGIVSHPFHLHGYQLYVTDIIQNFEQLAFTMEEAKQILAARDARPRSSNRRYPIKDTISIPSGGLTRFRFRADNPGFWFVHCHYEWHAHAGMAAILQVGETHEMVQPPADIPKCRNYNVNNLGSVLSPRWIPMKSTSALPLNCHIGGHEQTNITSGIITYVGRRNFGNEVLIGRVKSNTKKISVYRDTKEQLFDDYEIYCGGRVQWIARNSANLNQAVEIVKVNGNTQYVCQSTIVDKIGLHQVLTGSYSQTSNCCTTALGSTLRCTSNLNDFTLMQII